MLAEMLAAGLNANCGGRNHIGLVVERQIVSWAAELLGFPAGSSGIFVTAPRRPILWRCSWRANRALHEQVRRSACAIRGRS